MDAFCCGSLDRIVALVADLMLHGICNSEVELSSFLLSHVGQVKGHADQVRLGCVVILVLIVIDDQQVSVLLRCTHILEVIKVERIGQDVIRVDTLKGLALSLLDVDESLVL